ncbi:MAG: hypothetical protein AAF198_02060 [Pseudomonadota bacterium]
MLLWLHSKLLGILLCIGVVLATVVPGQALEAIDTYVGPKRIGTCSLYILRQPTKKRASLAIVNENSGSEAVALHLAQNPNEIVIEDEADRDFFAMVGTAQEVSADFLERNCGLSEIEDFYLLPHNYPVVYRGDEDFVIDLPFANQGAILVTFVAPNSSTGLRERYVYGLVGVDDTWTVSERQPLEYADDTAYVKRIRNEFLTYTSNRRLPTSFEKGAEVWRVLRLLASPLERKIFDDGTVVEIEYHKGGSIIGPVKKYSEYDVVIRDHLRHGMIVWPSGSAYYGHLDPVSYTKEGLGSMFTSSGRMFYRGGFKDNKFHYDGVIYLEDGSACRGDFENDELFRGTFWTPSRSRDGHCRTNQDGGLTLFD